MPKIRPSKALHLRQFVSECGEKIFSTNGEILFCKVCEIRISADKQFTVQQHIGRDKHVSAIQNTNKKMSQLLIGQSVSAAKSASSEFFMYLWNVLASANITLWKLKDFLKRHTGCSISEESTLRKIYVPVRYDRGTKFTGRRFLFPSASYPTSSPGA